MSRRRSRKRSRSQFRRPGNGTALATPSQKAIDHKKAVPNKTDTNSNGHQLLAHSEVRVEQFSGPLPHPAVLGLYNDAIPDGADRIMCMAENQQKHRMEMEKSVIESDIWKSKLGLFFAFVLCLLLVLGGFYLIYIGKNLAGYTFVIPAFSAMIANLFIERKRRQEQLKQSSKTETEQKQG